LERTITNGYLGYKKPAVGAAPVKSDHIVSDAFIRDNLVISLKARAIALAICLYFFIENGTLGLVPEKWYIIYRNVRLSDLILFGLIAYSIFNLREYYYLVKSKSFFITKVLLFYLVFEFGISAIKYQFNIPEYTFRLKGLWSSFLVLPYMLLYKRGGIGFLIKLIFPVAIISNILYILTALTGIAFLPDVSVITQTLPGDITVYRVYGGTFFGEFFFMGFLYMWITRKFRWWQLFLVILFVMPHVLAFGRGAWAFFVFCILAFIIINSLRKKAFRVLIRQALVFALLGITFSICFIKLIPESDYYVDAIAARLTQGQDDVKYNEGTYGARVLFQNGALIKLWMNNNWLVGVGMHPMWVVRAESYEEQVYYNAFCDVSWPAILAAYGLIGFVLSIIFQIYYMITTWKIIKRTKEVNLQTYFLTYVFAKMIFDTFINYTYTFISVGLWGLFPVMNFFVAVIVYNYEKQKANERLEQEQIPLAAKS